MRVMKLVAIKQVKERLKVPESSMCGHHALVCMSIETYRVLTAECQVFCVCVLSGDESKSSTSDVDIVQPLPGFGAEIVWIAAIRDMRVSEANKASACISSGDVF